MPMTMVWFVLFGLLAVVTCMALWRFSTLRSQGYPVVIRTLPNPEGRHWRHGVLVYSGTSAKWFKLRSVSPTCDAVWTRIGTQIMSRRQPNAKEAAFMESDLHIVEIDHRGSRWELAVDAAGDTALVAWLESAPSERRDRHSSYNKPRPMAP